jgi:N-6 DNA Methylase
MSADFTTIRTVGGMLPSDLLGRIVAGDKDLSGLTPKDYDLPNETPREAANRVWSYLFGVWTAYKTNLARLPEGDPAVGLTREKWLLVLFDQLGFGRVAPTPAGGLHVGDRAFPVSHLWGQVPLHLLGWGVELDKRTRGVAGAAERAPHAMVQELLNRTDEYLWAVVSNGQTLRLLRDSSSLSGQSYVDFDLSAMFDAEVFSDFAVMYLLLHRSRVEILSPGGPASDCWLERWRTTSIESGTRALGLLRDGVQSALEVLGTGFLQHPANADLRRRLEVNELSLEDYHRSLLRLVYRLLFLFVAEDRQALLIQDADPVAKAHYADYFSTARLRSLSRKRRGTRHSDLWEGLSLVITSLGNEQGCPELGVPGIGGLFDHGPADVVTGQSLPNDALLTSIRNLSVVQPKGQPKRSVDYRNLGAEELGSIYESLLELVPRHDSADQTFSLESLAGNERKTTGSYYTPTSLIDLVLNEALDPLLDDAEKSDNPAEALLALTICDPACGSGHFLVSAARRIADRLAVVRTGDVDPTPTDQQTAMYDVVAKCIYGVDLNPMAAELAKVSLWLEALQPGRPLTFLDAHIKVGNALLGTTPDLLAAGIPDAAYTPIEGDDRKHAAPLKKRNRAERERAGQGALFDIAGIDISNATLRAKLRDAVPARVTTLEDLHVAQRRYAEYEHSPALHQARRLADAWCTAFVQPKVPNAPFITQAVLDGLNEGSQLFTLDESSLGGSATLGGAVDDLIQQTARQYRFFHWYLEFPDIFDVTGGPGSTPTGWTGGFSATLGNPPWERVKLQEQEFFAARSPDIAAAPNMAARRKLIAKLATEHPELHSEFLAARRRAEGESHLLRSTGRYPLCGVGDVNTYSVFAEHMRSVIAPHGRMGVITPTGLATDATTAPFIADTLRSRRLTAFYDFVTNPRIWSGIGHNRFRFAVSCITGGEPVGQVRLAFDRRHPEDLTAAGAIFSLEPEEILLLNPNTGTLPIFASRTDAEITLGIYKRHPILIRDGDQEGNPWGVRFARLFDMATDSGLFRTRQDLLELGAEFDSWLWTKGDTRWLPLYEAKMMYHYDHRYATYAALPQGFQGNSIPKLSDSQHDDPECEPLARYWIDETEVTKAIGDQWDKDWLLGFRRLTRASDARTFIPFALPRSAVGDNTWIVRPNTGQPHALAAAWSSFVADYVVRQKLSGTTLSSYIVEQLACPAPKVFEASAPWDPSQSIADWLRPRVAELSYTSWRLADYARDVLGLSATADPGPPFRWVPSRREHMQADVDAAMFHVYGLSQPEVERVLDSFLVLRKYEERDYGDFRTKRLVLEVYDAMAHAAATGTSYNTVLDPPPGQGPRHQ